MHVERMMAMRAPPALRKEKNDVQDLLERKTLRNDIGSSRLQKIAIKDPAFALLHGSISDYTLT